MLQGKYRSPSRSCRTLSTATFPGASPESPHFAQPRALGCLFQALLSLLALVHMSHSDSLGPREFISPKITYEMVGPPKINECPPTKRPFVSKKIIFQPSTFRGVTFCRKPMDFPIWVNESSHPWMGYSDVFPKPIRPLASRGP